MHRENGFSMVEVLISIVVLSVALLGTAGLMSAGLRSTNTAYYRTQATVLADDMLDRMRSNATAARNGNYNLDAGGTHSAPSGSMAQFDLTEWRSAVTDILPAGDATITVNTGVATITIIWDNAANSFVTQSLL